MCDLFIFPSTQEGLPVALMEAISCKTQVICSSIRGNVELVQKEQTFDSNSVQQLIDCLNHFFSHGYKNETETNYSNLAKYELHSVIDRMMNIYLQQ